MKRLLVGCSLATLLLAASATAQDENAAGPASVAPATVQPGHIKTERALPELNPGQVSPEMYLYLQELRRHDDPKQAVRRKAEARTAAREARIASMKWYGMSNSRPQANPIPFMGTYSPTWVGNSYDRYDWHPGWWPSVSLRVDQSYEVRR